MSIKRILFLFLLILGVSDRSLLSIEQLNLHFLSELSREVIDELTAGHISEVLQPYHRQDLMIRGFLYRTKEGQLVLAAEPDLKSCCVASQKNINRQVILANSDIAFSNNGRAQEIQGFFAIEPLKDESGYLKELFVLHDARMMERSNVEYYNLLYFISALTLFALAGTVIYFIKGNYDFISY